MRLLVSLMGRIDYSEALGMQERLLKLRQKNAIEDVLLILEHNPVLTLGLGAKEDNIIASAEILRKQGIDVYNINRGGDVTYHGPGQVVGYPILDLTGYGKDVRDYVTKLEEVIIRLLEKDYGLKTRRIPEYRGVWVGNEKIAAIGCAIKKWVTMHGFALNVNTQLEHFRYITPCGITDKGVTSLEKIKGCPQDIHKVKKAIIHYFAEVFDNEPIIINRQELDELIQGDESHERSEAGMAEG